MTEVRDHYDRSVIIHVLYLGGYLRSMNISQWYIGYSTLFFVVFAIATSCGQQDIGPEAPKTSTVENVSAGIRSTVYDFCEAECS